MSEKRNASVTFTGPVRKDGKYPVTIVYPGEPNMFGGYYPSKVYRKLFTVDRLKGYLNVPWYDIHNLPRELENLDV